MVRGFLFVEQVSLHDRDGANALIERFELGPVERGEPVLNVALSVRPKINKGGVFVHIKNEIRKTAPHAALVMRVTLVHAKILCLYVPSEYDPSP